MSDDNEEFDFFVELAEIVLLNKGDNGYYSTGRQWAKVMFSLYRGGQNITFPIFVDITKCDDTEIVTRARQQLHRDLALLTRLTEEWKKP